ncbi:MAG TPA: LysR substrate-binding domain-containing protein, partial [Thermoanaerobaculia bacterium]|nr:LysR substrate-binding domain-containing protein [Thermoanaerobaculia bacterium]
LVAPGHRLAGRPYVRPRDLARERLLLYSPPATSNFYQQFLAGVEPQALAQVQLTEAIVSMIRAGLGVGPLPRWAVGEELRRGTVVGVPLGERGMRRQWSAATRVGARRPRYLADFLELVTASAGPSRFAQRQAAAAR